MKMTLIGLAFILSSTSIVLNKEKVYTEDTMTSSIDEKEIISGEEMVVRTGLITEPRVKSDCSSIKCWSKILKNVKK